MKKTKTIRFFNTFELVIPLWRYFIEYFKSDELLIKPVIVNRQYHNRDTSNSKAQENYTALRIPKFLGKSKMVSHVMYFILVPWLILYKKSSLNIFFTQPPLFFIIGSWLSRTKGTPYIVYIMDLYPEFLYSTYGINPNRFYTRALSKLADKALKNAQSIITIGQCMRSVILSKGIPDSKVLYIPNITSQEIKPINPESNIFLEKHQYLKSKIIILYSGNMGRAHIFKTILDSAKKLINQKDIIFLFVGNGHKKEEIKNKINEGLSNCKFIEKVSDKEFSHLLSAASIHFISLNKNYTGLVIPSKFYSSLAAGKPIIYEGAGEIALQIEAHNLGVVIKEGDSNKLVDSILKYKNEKKLITEQGLNARKLYESNYELGEYQKKYFSIIDEKVIKQI